MIIGTINEISQQAFTHPNLSAALEFLKTYDHLSVVDGRYSVKGEDVIAIVQTYTTKMINATVEVEGHRKFVDIQYVADGYEVLGWTSIENLFDLPKYNEFEDVWSKVVEKKDIDYFRLNPGHAAILFPSDAHAPQLIDSAPGLVKKIVMKVRL